MSGGTDRAGGVGAGGIGVGESGASGRGPAVGDPVMEEAAAALAQVLMDAEREIGGLAGSFEDLARETNGALESAAKVVSCTDGPGMERVLPGVRRLQEETARFLRERLRATAGILETVKGEAALLRRVEQQTQAQRGIARETEMLRVLTNIEVARLGEVGTGFEYLARELNDFSEAVARSTAELIARTQERRHTLDETRRTLETELPRVREEFARTEEGLARAAQAMERTVAQLEEVPERFRGTVAAIAGRVAGVVAAVQAHDITRQQMEHVRDALRGMARERGAEEAGRGAGLRIQGYQLRSIRETVGRWTAQIGTCLEDIGRVASGEILELAPAVLREEQELGQELDEMEKLEASCAAADGRVRASFAGVAGMQQLVNEHLERSRRVRERLQLLMFNSIVEASHLGSQADGILEISRTIKRIAAAWSEITKGSEQAMGEMSALVEASGAALEVFGEGRNEGLKGAQEEMQEALETLRRAGHCAETAGREIQEEIGGVQARIAGVGSARRRLESCFARLAEVLDAVEREEKRANAGAAGTEDVEALERRFGAEYTTEMERAVLRAALAGGPLPGAEMQLEGNSVELF